MRLKSHVTEDLDSISTLIEFLDQDKRPTFILDMRNQIPETSRLELVYNNPALSTLLDTVSQSPGDTETKSHFLQWATSPSTQQSFSVGRAVTWTHGCVTWMSCLIKKRWKIIYAHSNDAQPLPGAMQRPPGQDSTTLGPLPSQAGLPMPGRSLPSQLNGSRSTSRQNLKRPRLSAPPTRSSSDIIPFVPTGFDETACLVACKRRMSTALKLGERTASVDNIKDLWRAVVEILETNPHDVPFALMYSVHQESSTRIGLEANDTASVSEKCLLEGVVGIEDCSAIVQCFNLTESSEGLAQTFRTASHSREPQLLQDNESNFLGILTKPVSLDQNLGDLFKKTIVCSIPSIDGASSKAFLIIGMNPQSPIDDHYWMFVRLLSEELAKSVASVSLLEEERRRKMAAEETALRYASVSKELLQRTQAAESTEHMFRRLSEAASVGCAMFRADATVIWMNRAYCQLTGRPQEDFSPETWPDVIIPEDRPFVEQQWKRLASGEAIQPFEFRVSRHKTSSTGKADSEDTTGHRWLLSNAIPELNEDGSCRVVMGWLTDISHQKWSEHLQSKRLEDALENKRRSENFIDMVGKFLALRIYGPSNALA